MVVRPKGEGFRSGDPVELEAVLENASGRRLWVNRRLLFNGEFAPAPFRELWLSVVGPDGHERRFECKVRAAEARPQDYGVLAPGERVVSTLRLDQCFDLAQKGSYTVVAHYADGNRHIPPAPAGAEHLAGTLHSGEVTLRIR